MQEVHASACDITSQCMHLTGLFLHVLQVLPHDVTVRCLSYCMGSVVLISSRIYLYLQLLWCGILDTLPWFKGYLHVRFQSLCNFNNTLKVLHSIVFVIVIINANIRCKSVKLSLQFKDFKPKNRVGL
jgi:hypothetical protein